MAIAKIAPTNGTFGIWWDWDVKARGYSGPYSTPEEAEQGARDWTEAYDEPLTIERLTETP